MVGYRADAFAFGDLDGDGLPELILGRSSATVSVLKNLSTTGSINFSPKTDYPCRRARYITIADLDNDGKPEIIGAGLTDSVITILRNKIAEPILISLCPSANISIPQNLSGTNYQWQVNNGTGFSNITNNSNHNNSNAAVLQINNVPSVWSGYLYRCVVDGRNSYSYSLKFTNLWNGNTNGSWENPANRSCGTIPDANTDVVITSGNVIINSNVTIRSLTLSPGVIFNVNPGFTLTILH